MNRRKDGRQLEKAELSQPLPFTKNMPVLKLPFKVRGTNPYQFGNALYDLKNDPLQLNPIDDPETEKKMIQAMKEEMIRFNAPEEQFERLGI